LPLDLQERPLSDITQDCYRNVIRDNPEVADLLVSTAGRRLFEASFNSQPIALLLACPDTQGSWQLEALVVHPANHGRGIDRALVEWVQQQLGAPLHDEGRQSMDAAMDTPRRTHPGTD